jgi:membrane-anchored glycerophosphoryl diester phosphodiesterase (GDPDase)
MRIISRVLHALLVLTLTFLLIWSVYYAFSLLGSRAHPRERHDREAEEYDRIPTVQDIVSRSFRCVRYLY